MKLYSSKYHRHIERQVHFGVGKSTHTACGHDLFSRNVMVSIHSGDDGALITDDLRRVTCKRCLASNDVRLRKLIEIEKESPGIFDRASLCGEKWLLDNALDITQKEIDSQQLEVSNGDRGIVVSNAMKSKDRKYIFQSLK